MPAVKKSPANGGWGITWADVGVSQVEHQRHHRCVIEFSVYHYQKYKKNEALWVWSVVAHARRHANQPDEVRGWGTCDVGHGSGAASMPGAFLRALLNATTDLEDRVMHPTKAQEQHRLPGF